MNMTTPASRASRGLVIGLPSRLIESDADFGRLRRRQRALLAGRPIPHAADTFQSLLEDATAKVVSVIARLERERNGTVAPPEVRVELRAEVARFKANAKDHRYRFVKLTDVPQATRDAVLDGLQRACNKIGGLPANSGVLPWIPTPSVRFFRAARDGERADFSDHRSLRGQHVYETDFIDVRADLPPAEARRTAAHECWHWSGKREARDEVSAGNFSAAF